MSTQGYKIYEDLLKTPNSLLNRPATGDDLLQMQNWLEILCRVCRILPEEKGLSNAELNVIEESLGVRIPSTLRLLYSYVGKDLDFLVSEYSKSMDYKLLKPAELYVEPSRIIHDAYTDEVWFETDILIYAVSGKKFKPYKGVDLTYDWGLFFYKEWYWQKDERPLYKDLIVLLTCITISHMPYAFKTKLKGLSAWEADKSAEQRFVGYLKRFPDFEHYAHTLFYNEERCALGWFRSGSALPDLLLGSNDKDFTEKFIADFDLTKAKRLK